MLQVIPILRAGLVLLEQAGTVLPASQTFHVGYVRDEATLQVSLLYGRQHEYYSYRDAPIQPGTTTAIRHNKCHEML